MTFKVCINEGEWDQIHDWVLKHKNIETGGDLFGLWLDGQTAVVQFVLGPGKNSERTTTSFFQDVHYLHQAGTYLTKHHGLCNVGQWHSHHRINLSKPSVGDENTVWNNMPNLGLDRYIVFIANITPAVTINCFLFQIKNGERLSVQHGKFEILQGNSPLRLNEKILQNVYGGAESFNKITNYENENKRYSLTASAQREKIGKRYAGERVIAKREEQNKDRSNQKWQESAYHSSTAKGGRPLPEVGSRVSSQSQRFVGYGTHYSKQGTTTRSDNGSRVPTNQGDLHQSNTGNGQQSTNTTTESYNSPKSLQTTEIHKKQTSTKRTPRDQRDTQGQREDTVTKPTTTVRVSQSYSEPFNDTYKQRVHAGTENVMSKQDSKSQNAPITSKEPDVKKTTPKSSENCDQANKSQSWWKKQLHVNKESDPTKVENQRTQTPVVKFKGTPTESYCVIVTQPDSKGFNTFNRKRKSGDYDNVKYEDSPQPKSSRPDSAIETNPRLKDSLEVITETPVTPSGTMEPFEKKYFDNFTQQEQGGYNENTWANLVTSICCGMSKLTISEPTVEKISTNNAGENSAL